MRYSILTVYELIITIFSIKDIKLIISILLNSWLYPIEVKLIKYLSRKNVDEIKINNNNRINIYKNIILVFYVILKY